MADDILYSSVSGAFQYMWLLSIGELGADDDNYSKTTNAFTEMVLWILFFLATFLVLVHMLNMLIAVMTDTFTVNNESEQETKMKEHLQFVMDNWWTLKKMDKTTKTKTNYLIAAWAYEEDEENIEIHKEL